MSLRIKQAEKYLGNDWWEWAVWLDGPPAELALVTNVVYTLHPSFTPPVHTIRTRRNGFLLAGRAWGTFTMHLDIRFRDKTVRQRKYDLKLFYPEEHEAAQSDETTAPPSVFLSSTATDADTAQAIKAALVTHGIEVLSDAELGAGSPLSRSVEAGLAKAGHALFVMSGRPSLWMSREIEAARWHKVPIIAILVGESARAPEFLDSTQRLRIKDASEVNKVIEKVTAVFGAAESAGSDPARGLRSRKAPMKRGA